MPALASVAIFQFLWVWNDMLVVLVFVFLALQRYFVRGLLAGSYR